MKNMNEKVHNSQNDNNNKRIMIIIIISILAIITIVILATLLFKGNNSDDNTIDKFIITYNTESEPIKAKEVTKGDFIGTLPTGELEGYVFEGWYYEDTYTTLVKEDDIVNEDLNLYAKFLLQITISFMSKGAQEVASRVGIEGSVLTSLPEVSKENYKFEGWYYEYNFVTLAKEGDILTNPVVLYAKFTEYFDISYVTLGDAIPSVKVLSGSTIGNLPKTSKESLVFGGWYYDSDYTMPVSESDKVFESKALYAYLKETLEVNYIVDGKIIETKQVQEGDLLESMTAPYSLGYTFDGWYTNEQYSNLFHEEEKVRTNLNLYAKYSENKVSEKESISYECLEDIEANYIFTVLSNNNLEIAYFKRLVELTNLSIGEKEDFDVVVNAVTNGYEYSITGLNGEFNSGSSYRLKLNHESLNFSGQDQEIREYNFNIIKEEVLNLRMNGDIIYILSSEISSIIENELSQDHISGGLITLNSNGELTSELSKGTFVFSGSLSVGDKICIYSGVRPDLRTLETAKEDCGQLSYVIITSKEGNTYGYTQAEAKDIIFKPDILPIPVSADMDGDAFNSSITIYSYFIDYSLDIYSNINLSSETTVDIGDYLMFYTGEFSKYLVVSSYAEVISIELLSDMVIISFDDCTWDEISHSMDLYVEEQISGEELLEGINQAQLEQSICLAAEESGFVDLACDYLTTAALLSGDLLTEKDYTRYKTKRYASDEFDIDIDSNFHVTVTTTLVHFNGSGFRVAFTITSQVIFTNKTTKERSVIDITGEFEQEVRLDFNVDCDTVWKVYGIIPYIADYKVSISVDLYDYTGIEINATMLRQYKSSEGTYVSDNEYIDISERMQEYFDEPTDEEGATLCEELSSKYQSLVDEETQWVTIVNKELTKKEFRVPTCLPIVVCEIKINFIVKIDASACTGITFHYENAKRYVYSISLFKGKVSNDVINISKEKYDFSFSFLGRLRVKAGIETIFKVGLISTKLDNIGFIAESGAYVYSYGYFYYTLAYKEGVGKKITKDGALFVEVGAYLDIDFVAEVLGGKYSSTKSIYYQEFPLYTVGDYRAVLDFSIEEDLPEVFLKQYIRNSSLPDTLFAMDVQDLYSGWIYSKQYSDKDDFIIEITNPHFVYNPTTNIITVIPNEDDTTLEGDMIITFKNRSLSFTSSPLTRVIHLYWDNLRDGYIILPFTNGGSYIPSIIKASGEEITIPTNPVRQGYEFAGWYSDPSFMTAYEFPKVMGEYDTTIYAKWIESADTKYIIEHYLEKLGSSDYELVETTIATGTTASLVTPMVNTYSGFISPVEEKLIIGADGTSVQRYYYNRVLRSITFNYGRASNESEQYILKYGADITPPILFFEGYIFTGWDKPVIKTMGAEDLVYVAQWDYVTPLTSYKVEYYIQDENGRILINHQIVIEDVEIDTLINVDSLYINSYINEGLTYHGTDTIDGIKVTEFKPNVDGSTVLKIIYLRYQYKVTYILNNNYPNIEFLLYSGKQIVPEIPDPTKNGYTFIGWDKDTPNELLDDVNIIAIWEEIEYQEYRILRYFASATDRYDFSLYYEDIVTNSNDLYKNISEKTYTGLYLDTEVTGDYMENAVIEGDCKIINLYYSRNIHKYSMYYENNEAIPGYQDVEFVYGASIEVFPESISEDRIIYKYSIDGEDFYGVLPDKDCIIIQHTRSKVEVSGEYAGIIYCSVMGVNYSYNEYGDYIKATEYIIGEKDTSMTYRGLFDTTPGLTLMGEGETIFFVPLEEGGMRDVELFYYPSYYDITFNYNDGILIGFDPLGQGCVCGQNDFNAPLLEKVGYILSWDKPIPHFLPYSNDRTLVFNAIWTLDTNAVIFRDIEGNEITRFSGEPDMEVTLPKPPERVGYTFSGNWSPDNPQVVGGGITNYYPIYNPIHYDIEYVYNTTDTVINNSYNKDYYTIQNGTIGLYEPQRRGYTFLGWYDNNDFIGERKTLIEVDPLNLHSYTYYAKWQANPYVVIFDNGLLSDLAEEETQMFVYDVAQDLKLNPFTNHGYRFIGWAESPNGEVLYEDGQNVSQVASGSEIRLYACWEATDYKITYLNSELGEPSNNPDVYTIEDDIIFEDLIGKDKSFVFLGWFDEYDNQVKGFSKGHENDLVLTAKWAHGGIFNIELVSPGYITTFKITRTIPMGAIATTDPQQVYYRTQNGTAVGGTAKAINFLHVGGPEVLVTFYQDDVEKTFTVTDIRSENEYSFDGVTFYPQNAYTTIGYSKYFTAEIYKVISTIGNCTGVIGDHSSQRVDLTSTPQYQMDYSYYNEYQPFKEDYEVYVYRLSLGEKGFDILPFKSLDNYNEYYSLTSDGYYWFMTVSIDNKSDEKIIFSFDLGDLTDVVHLSIEDSGYYLAKFDDVHIPLPDFAKTGNNHVSNRQFQVCFVRDVFDYNAEEQAYAFPLDATTFELSILNESYGTGRYVSNLVQYTKLYDKTAPKQIGLAPLSFGTYKKGDKIQIAVVYNEIIQDVNNLSIADTKIGNLSLKDFTFVEGLGSCVLVFEATVDSDSFEVDPNFNNIVVNTKLAINGEIKDEFGNK